MDYLERQITVYEISFSFICKMKFFSQIISHEISISATLQHNVWHRDMLCKTYINSQYNWELDPNFTSPTTEWKLSEKWKAVVLTVIQNFCEYRLFPPRGGYVFIRVSVCLSVCLHHNLPSHQACQLDFLTKAKIRHFWDTVCPRKRF